jgi:hypothetical protein
MSETNSTSSTSTNGERFCNRPGSALVPGLWRLFYSCAGTESDAIDRDTQRKYCDHQRDRLQQPFSLLHEYLRHAQHPRPRNSGGEWIESCEAGTECLDRNR